MRLFTLTFKIFIGFVACAIVAELILSLFPVATGFQRDTENFPIRHWKPDSNYVYSNGWNFRNAQKGSTNNYGFSNVKDYTKNGAEILLIGDSYFEAQQVSRGNTIEDVIQKLSNKNTYTISVSGSALPDYIKYLEYGLKEFNPKQVVVKIFDADLVGAFTTEYPMGSYFVQTENSFILKTTEANLTNFKMKNFFKKSSLLRYCLINLKILEQIKLAFDFTDEDESIEPDLELLTKKLKVYLSVKFKELNLDKKSVLILTNHETLFTNLATDGFNVLNIEKALSKIEDNTDYSMNFAPYDYHWNFRGHFKAGQAVNRALQGM